MSAGFEEDDVFVNTTSWIVSIIGVGVFMFCVFVLGVLLLPVILVVGAAWLFSDTVKLWIEREAEDFDKINVNEYVDYDG